MTQEDKNKIVEILRFHGSMIGIDESECKDLILKVKRVYCSDQNLSMEEEMHNEMKRLCSMIGYEATKENNKAQEVVKVAMRDAVSKRILEQYPHYPRLPHVIGDFFGKERSTGHSMIIRSEKMYKINDSLFMHEYNKTFQLIESE